MVRQLAAAALGLMILNATAFAQEKDSAKETPMTGRIYELRTYYCVPGRLPKLHQRFKEHTLALFEKHGMKNEMYWTPLGADHANKLIYIVSHDSEEAAKKSWAGFRADPVWIKARDASEADGKIVEKVESVMMKEADFFGKK